MTRKQKIIILALTVGYHLFAVLFTTFTENLTGLSQIWLNLNLFVFATIMIPWGIGFQGGYVAFFVAISVQIIIVYFVICWLLQAVVFKKFYNVFNF